MDISVESYYHLKCFNGKSFASSYSYCASIFDELEVWGLMRGGERERERERVSQKKEENKELFIILSAVINTEDPYGLSSVSYLRYNIKLFTF